MTEEPLKSEDDEPSSDVLLGRGVKVLGELVVGPGTSLALDGQILPGVAHYVGGLLARWAFGPVGWLLVAANSYSTSVTGRGLAGQIQGSGAAPPETEAPPSPPAAAPPTAPSRRTSTAREARTPPSPRATPAARRSARRASTSPEAEAPPSPPATPATRRPSRRASKARIPKRPPATE